MPDVLVADTLVIVDHVGSRIVVVRETGKPYGIATTGGGAHLPPDDVARFVEFLGGHIVTEDEILARIAQQEYYDLLTEKAREVHDLLERGVRERADDPAAEGTPLYDSRVYLGLDGATGARDIRTQATEA